MIIITDAHVAEARGNHTAFFQMIGMLEKSDQDIVFLGDIFELWIAFERYEENIHRRFLAWCAEQKKRRTIGYVEGNHEYFLADQHRDCFTWVTDTSFRQNESGVLFAHGDLVNRNDRNYLRFRKLAKSTFTRQLARFLPFGPFFVHYLNRRLKSTNLQYRQHLPVDEISAFADEAFQQGVESIFIGHFHRKYEYRAGAEKILRCLPAWLRTGEVTAFDPTTGRFQHHHWRTLPL